MSQLHPPHSSLKSFNEDSDSQKVVKLVWELVGKLATTEPKRQQALSQYVLRIIGSRLPVLTSNDEYSLISSMKKYLVNHKSNEDAMALDSLYAQLTQMNAFSQLKYTPSSAKNSPETLRFSLLYLLYQCRKDYGVASLNGGRQSVLNVERVFMLSDLSLSSIGVQTSSSQLSKAVAMDNKDNLLKEKSQQPIGRVLKDSISEAIICRDLMYVLQGLDGDYVKFDIEKDVYDFLPTLQVSRSTRIMVRRISELGALFRQVRHYLEMTQASNSKGHLGLIEQSFREGVSEEIRSYYKMVSVLESQIIIAHPYSTSDPTSVPASSSNFGTISSTVAGENAIGGNQMTLRKLIIWTSEPLRRMKWLFVVVANDLKGDEMQNNMQQQQSTSRTPGNWIKISMEKSASELAASRMNQLTQLRHHGDPYVQSLGRTLEIYTSRPLLNMIQNWIFQGTLNDPFKEFFVVKNDSIVPRISHDLGETSRPDRNYWDWKNQYLILQSRIPPFISQKMAYKIMVIGKSINFMKHCCDDADWIASTTRRISLELEATTSSLTSFDQLKHPIQQLFSLINSRLVFLVMENFHILQHMAAIRKYLFLGQGDFTQVLMETIESELNLPAGKQYKHNILPIVDGALRSSVASAWPPYLLACCEIYLPSSKDLSSNSNLTSSFGTGNFVPQDGWDIFELAYKLSRPLDAILGSKPVLLQQSAIFKFLWRLRRVHYILSGTWRFTTNCTRQLSHLVPEINPLLQRIHLIRHQMTHFASIIQYYIMFEVMETAWAQLHIAIEASKSLDQIVQAYDSYMNEIIKTSLVDDPMVSPVDIADSVNRGIEPEQTPAVMIRDLLDIIREFDQVVKELYETTYEVASRRSQRESQEPALDEDGNPKWGVTPEDEQLDYEFLDHLDNVLTVDIETIADKYKHGFDQLFTSLAQKMREGDDAALRNLFQRINFNSYYANESTPSSVTTNAENATLILQATLGSMKEDPTLTPSSIPPSRTAAGLVSNRGLFSQVFSNESSSMPSGSASPAVSNTSAEYTEQLLKQAAAKLKLANLAASAQQRSSTGKK